jgi:hypothetical protein
MMNLKSLTKKLFITTFIMCSTKLNAQNDNVDAPAKQLANYVTPFTGDFSYNIPLVTVTGPNGEAFPLNIAYGAGIRVNQEASWVGLGWNLNVGEIIRNVKGAPDDFNRENFKEEKIIPSSSAWEKVNESNVFGPLYFNEISGSPSSIAKKMDLYGTDRGLGVGSIPFTFPDYDEYYVSAPGITAKMRPYIFDFAEYYGYDNAKLNSRSPREFSAKPMFRMVNEPMAELKNTTNFLSYLSTNSNNQKLLLYKEPLSNNNVGDTWVNRNGDNNVFDAGNYIEYFTNQQIIDGGIAGFIDCAEALSRSSNPDGIGAFRVTTPNGMVYHYSLPVYIDNETVKTFEANNKDYTSPNKLTRYTKGNKYAYSWKLTAITGVNYEDVNANKTVDESDKGYWIEIKYSNWTSNFEWKSPYYNFHPDFDSDKKPTYVEGTLTYEPNGSVVEGTSEIFYPEYIKTATQTAYFIKGVRSDDHSIPDGSGDPTPKLYLKYVVLMDNDDVDDNGIFASSQSVTSSDFSNLSSLANTTGTLSTEDYTYYQTAIETYALKTIAFNYDYHLCQKLPNNINNTFSESTVSLTYTGGSGGSEAIYIDGTYSSTTDLDLSGKLTLNSIATYEQNHTQITSPYLFDYNNDNPDFSQEKQDIFGYYKDNYNASIRNRYITSDNDKVDAWSLVQITTPMGSEIDVEYESDTYNGVVYDSEYSMPRAPTRLFETTAEASSITYYTSLASSTKTFTYQGTNYTEMILNEVYGGGIRVKNISLTDPLSSQTYKLSYTYDEGIATVEPDKYKRSVSNKLIKSKHNEDRHAGVPGVGYTSVEITIGDGSNNIGSSKYSFKNYLEQYTAFGFHEDATWNDVYTVQLNYYPPTGGWYEVFLGTPNPFSSIVTLPTTMTIDYNLDLIKMRHNVAAYGNPNSVIHYDANGVEVSKTTYEYSDFSLATGGDDVGVIQEVFYDYADFRTDDTERKIFKNTYFMETIVTHLKKVTKKEGGITSITSYEDRDNFTGIPSKILTNVSGYNTNTVYKTFAYENNSDMGAKTTDADNLNLLIPVQTQLESRGAGSNSEWSNSLITRSWNAATDQYQTTSETNIWMPIETSIFNGGSVSSPTWKKNDYNSLFGGRDGEVNLEQKDMKDRYVSSKFGYDNRYKIAEVSNCNYTSFAYSGFESDIEVEAGVYHFEGEIEKGSGVQVGQTGLKIPHTGDYMVQLAAGQFGPIFKAVVNNATVSGEDFERGIQVGRTYIASVWVHKDSPDETKLVYSLDGNQTDYQYIQKDNAEAIQIGDWIQLRLTFTVPDNYVSSGGAGTNDFRVYLYNAGSANAYYDDFMIHPVDAKFSGYVYDERLGQVKAVISNDNFYTRFEHDNAGNVIKTYKETQNGEKVISTSEYHFK